MMWPRSSVGRGAVQDSDKLVAIAFRIYTVVHFYSFTHAISSHTRKQIVGVDPSVAHLHIHCLRFLEPRASWVVAHAE